MKRVSIAGSFLAMLGLAACLSSAPTGGGGSRGAVRMAAASGNGQRGLPNTVLPEPLVVKVTDATGSGVAGIVVNWARTGGDGTLSRREALSDANGDAAVALTLGGSEGEVSVNAFVNGLIGSPVRFAATAALPSAIEKSGGDGQSAGTGQPLPLPLEVTVTAADGGPVPGATVNWSVTGGGGSLVAMSSETDVDGTTSNGLTLGPDAGTNTVTATVEGAPALVVEFTAEGTVPGTAS